ncbi:winged helix-turn-helix transcriptional regulator [Shimazuella kribbensis]|uniref:winged helix-turn-helix transcriptional regulator n=1 Tax=Shimazuella kribbensis TaxID=139808 RepID=UPI0004005E7D|nr:helix-turn-helix domain-containing protein [Shimazuella kribbensis]
MTESKKKYRIGVEAALDVISGKWKSIVFYHLATEKKRTNELKNLIPQITQKMLTKQLRELERDGIINRIIYKQIPPKVEYELTEYGRSLKTALNYFCEWGETHLDKVYGDKNSVLDNFLDNEKHC